MSAGADASPTAGAGASGVGGVVFEVEGTRWFLPASVAIELLPMPTIARVPGAPPELVGVTLVDGEAMPVVALVPPDRIHGVRSRRAPPMLLCSWLGERIALVGLEVVGTGRFEPGAGDSVIAFGAEARAFDVAGVFARLREGRWAV